MAGYSYAQAPLILSCFWMLKQLPIFPLLMGGGGGGGGGGDARLHLIGDGWSCGRLVVNLFIILRLIAIDYYNNNTSVPPASTGVGLYHLPDFQILNSSYSGGLALLILSFSVYSFLAIIMRNHSGCVLFLVCVTMPFNKFLQYNSDLVAVIASACYSISQLHVPVWHYIRGNFSPQLGDQYPSRSPRPHLVSCPAPFMKGSDQKGRTSLSSRYTLLRPNQVAEPWSHDISGM